MNEEDQPPSQPPRKRARYCKTTQPNNVIMRNNDLFRVVIKNEENPSYKAQEKARILRISNILWTTVLPNIFSNFIPAKAVPLYAV